MKLYKYRIAIPKKPGSKKLTKLIFTFTTPHLGILLDYYNVPYEIVK